MAIKIAPAAMPTAVMKPRKMWSMVIFSSPAQTLNPLRRKAKLPGFSRESAGRNGQLTLRQSEPEILASRAGPLDARMPRSSRNEGRLAALWLCRPGVPVVDRARRDPARPRPRARAAEPAAEDRAQPHVARALHVGRGHAIASMQRPLRRYVRHVARLRAAGPAPARGARAPRRPGKFQRRHREICRRRPEGKD